MKKITIVDKKDKDLLVVNKDRLIDLKSCNYGISVSPSNPTYCIASVRCNGELAGNGIVLDSGFEWVIGEDSQEHIVLVPLKKEKE